MTRSHKRGLQSLGPIQLSYRQRGEGQLLRHPRDSHTTTSNNCSSRGFFKFLYGLDSNIKLNCIVCTSLLCQYLKSDKIDLRLVSSERVIYCIAPYCIGCYCVALHCITLYFSLLCSNYVPRSETTGHCIAMRVIFFSLLVQKKSDQLLFGTSLSASPK